jgi:hypothetical protein
LSEVLVIVAVVAVIAIAAVVIMRGRKSSATGVSESPAAVAAPPVEPSVPPKREEPAEAAPVAESEAVEDPPKAVEAVAAAEVEEIEVEAPVEAAEPEPAPEEVAQPSAEEISARVRTQLDDSKRMLGELTAAAEHAESPPHDLGTLEIMQEGLQEVRTALDKKDWSQAKDKGDALYAQLSLMVQSVRREQAS